MADGVRLVGMVVGSFLALYAGNIGFQVNKSLLPNFFTTYYYTSYFPGINKLHKHDIFREYPDKLEKVAIVGSSSAESIGCDASWTYKDSNRHPMRNISKKCSIPHNINLMYNKNSKNDYEFFNLAKAGAKFFQVVNISKNIIKSDVKRIIYLVQLDYFYKLNYGLDNIDSIVDKNDILDFINLNSTEALQHYDLVKIDSEKNSDISYDALYNYIKLGASNFSKSTIDIELNQKLYITVKDVIASFLFSFHEELDFKDDQPGEVVLYPEYFKEEKFDGNISKIKKGLRLFELMSEVLELNGVEMNVVFLPDVSLSASESLTTLRASSQYQNLESKGILMADLIDFELKPILENYDGKHLTLYGNIKVAEELTFLLKQKKTMD